MRANVYAPTLEQRKEGLKVAERFWSKQRLIRAGFYAAVPLVLGWYHSGFAFPFTVDGDHLAVGVLAALLGEIIDFFSKKDRAKFQCEEDEEATQAHGPLQYRLTESGLDLWSAGEHEHRSWDLFRKFKLTDELLIVVLFDSYSEYWVFPRKDIDESTLSVTLHKLQESGAIRVLDQRR